MPKKTLTILLLAAVTAAGISTQYRYDLRRAERRGILAKNFLAIKKREAPRGTLEFVDAELNGVPPERFLAESRRFIRRKTR